MTADLDLFGQARAAPPRARAADHPADWYPTPPAPIRALRRELELPGGHWLEPAAGDGRLAVEIQGSRSDIRWDLVELRPEGETPLILRLGGKNRIDCPANYLERKPRLRYDVAITNPPFSLAERFVAKMREEAKVAVCLLRLGFLGGQRRAAFMRAHPPDVYVLSQRPSFTGDGTDNGQEYAWFVWGLGGGRLVVLPPEGAGQQLEIGSAR